MIESMIQNSVGKSLREVRNRYGMNQENLALKLGIKRQTISSYERGVTVSGHLYSDSYRGCFQYIPG